MTREELVEKFELFASAPGGLAKLRELVLELAVRGMLSEHLALDVTDSEWRDFNEVSPRGRGLEPPFTIPRQWRWVTLKDLGSTRPRNIAADETLVSFVPMAMIPSEHGRRLQSEKKAWGIVRKVFTHFADGDVVMAKITPCFENGKSVVMRNLTNGIGAGTTELHVFRRNTSVVVPEFVLIYLKTPGFIARGISQMTGSAGQKRVPASYFADSPFPLPPPAEQERIVAKVDELMELCARLEAQQKERETRHAALARASLAHFGSASTPANLQLLFNKSYCITPADLRETILTLAFKGQLVSQDPRDMPAHEWLKQSALQPSIAAPNGQQLPASWSEVRFDDVAIVAGGVTLGRKLGTKATVTLPYLRVANVKRGAIDLTTIKNVTIAEGEINRYSLRPNDLLLTEGGDWDKVGRAAIWQGQIQPCLYQNHVFRARMRFEDLTPKWFEQYFNSPVGRRYFGSAAKQTTNLASINMRQVRACRVPFPPLAEQHRILSKIDELMALVNDLEAKLSSAEKTGAKLLDAMVTELTAERVSDHGSRNASSPRSVTMPMAGSTI